MGKNSQNTAQRRRIAVAFRREKFVFTAKIRRICEKFAKIRKCDVFSPFFEKHLFVNFSFFGRKYGRKAKNSQKFASATANRRRFAGENASHCEEFAKIRKCDGVTPSQAKTRRKYGENASQMRILRRNLAHFGRICEDFAPRIFRKCAAFSTSDRRRKSVALRKIPKISKILGTFF